MLYGNLIFIKKSGGDGSKFPVTEKKINIGRSEDCLIRIYNPQVAAEHCQLIIGDNGQATLKNFSAHTILNGKALELGDVTLCHGDIFKLGERLVRWEYLPASKYYQQILSQTGRLVAVVMPQQRSLGDQGISRNSASQVSGLKSVFLGKRKYSERGTPESSSTAKIKKSNNTDLISKSKNDLSKLLISRHSFKATKLLLNGAKVKDRKSISGMVSSKTPKIKLGGKSRKSTLPSWKVNIVTPPNRRSKGSANSASKSHKKSEKSPKSAVNTPLKDILESKSSEDNILLPVSKKTTKTPQKIVNSNLSERANNSVLKGISKTPSKSIAESASRKSERALRTTRSLSKPFSPKSPSKVVLFTPKQKFSNLSRLVHSEIKLNSDLEKYPGFLREAKGMSLILEKMDSNFKQGLVKKECGSVSGKKRKEKVFKETTFDNTITPVTPEILNKESPIKKKQIRKSLKSTPLKKLFEKTSVESSLKETPKAAETEVKLKTLQKSGVKTTSKTPKENKSPTRKSTNKEVNQYTKTPLIDFNSTSSLKNDKLSRKSDRSTSVRKSLNRVENAGKKSFSKSPFRETITASPSPVSRKRKKAHPLKTSVSSTKKVRRKLSPSSSAERAADILKTRSPKKPDKNKKRALLVLGIANRKQLLSQNMKVFLKQKIVKKAIKHSAATASLKNGTNKKLANKKVVQKKSIKKDIVIRKSPPNVSTAESSVETQAKNSKGKIQSEMSPTIVTKVQALLKSPLEKNTDFPDSIISTFSSFNEETSPSGLDKPAGNYFFNSSRRCSKRLSCKNDTSRPDFVELSPTALGLMPKNAEVFKTLKESKRKTSSLVTPKNIRTMGIIRSASTSKIGSRKSVRFSPKDVSYHSEFFTPNNSEKVDFDLSTLQTPDITLDVFVSPLKDKSSMKKNGLKEYKTPKEDMSYKIPKGSSEPKCVRKLLQSPQVKKSLFKVSPQESVLRITKNSPATQTKADEKKRLKKDVGNTEDIHQAFATPKTQKNQKGPKNDLTDVRGVKKLLRTPKQQKSPKNNLSDLRGVKKLLRTPKQQKSPKNDLTDVRGVRKLLRTPKQQKSPKNDLTDVRGVKKLLRTPKQQKSPKNDLTDVRGVKKLLRTPKQQKSPKNDLTDVRGVKKLLRTPKQQKSPKNDLTDVRGVKKLLRTPKQQKSPKNDLTDVRGVKKLLRTPKQQKSPKNDLTDVRGVKKLLRTPKQQKSPKNSLSDLRGVKNLLGSPRVQKSSETDLTYLTAVKKLLATPRAQESPKNSLLEVSGMGTLFETPAVQKLSIENAMATPDSPLLEINLRGMEELLISKNTEDVLKSTKTLTRKNVKNFKAIRGRHTIYATPKGPKNDLSDVAGVRELFARHKATNDYSVNLEGISELFDFENIEVSLKGKRGRKLVTEEDSHAAKESRRTIEIKSPKKVQETKTPVTRRSHLRQAATKKESIVKYLGSEKPKGAVKEKRPTKRKTSERVKSTQAKKSSAVVAKQESKTSKKESQEPSGNEKVESTRKRKASIEVSDLCPPKLRRKQRVVKDVSEVTSGTTRRVVSRSNRVNVTEEKISVKSIKKVSPKNKTPAKASPKVQSKKEVIKSGTKRIQKVQNGSQKNSKVNSSNSEIKISPRRTRSAKIKAPNKTTKITASKTQTKAVQKKTVKSTAGRDQSSAVIKRSTRRK